MHISEGVLSAPVLLAGAAAAVPGIAVGMRKLEPERLMVAALLSAAFFVASLVRVPIGPASAHLILNGLLGLLLGWAVFPAIFAALILQMLLFQYGGLLALGVNTVTMALPAALCSMLFSRCLRKGPKVRFIGAFCCGFFSIAGAALLTALALTSTDDGFIVSAKLLFLAHLPIIPAEGVLTALAVSFIAKVRPELLNFKYA